LQSALISKNPWWGFEKKVANIIIFAVYCGAERAVMILGDKVRSVTSEVCDVVGKPE
jgi:hypothetical protein